MAKVSANRSLRNWLLLVCVMIFSMVAVGGLTRLTRSGLSIVEWKPISGVVPPLNELEWEQEFTKYKQYPEYQQVNQGMELAEFKYIFYWEYFHRLLGRLIGLVFAVPLIVFFWRRQISASLGRRLGFALVLGGLQGALGWYMVKSGLTHMPRVSHYRLAAHLGLALFLLSFLYWLAQDLQVRAKFIRRVRGFAVASRLFLALLVLQLFYGALTAGLRAGHMFNTFPTMNGFWLPPGIGSLGWMRDMFDNPVTVQFIHRSLGFLTLTSALLMGWMALRSRELTRSQKSSLLWVSGVVLFQFVLGVLVLVYAVPVPLGAAHQMGACVLLLVTLRAVYLNRLRPGPSLARPTIRTAP